LEYLNSRGYKYEIYDKSSTEDTEAVKSEKNKPKTINVYSKGENANLSNFAPRPFRTQVSKTYPAVNVNHVEHAF
jgi:hypothetical protein